MGFAGVYAHIENPIMRRTRNPAIEMRIRLMVFITPLSLLNSTLSDKKTTQVRLPVVKI